MSWKFSTTKSISFYNPICKKFPEWQTVGLNTHKKSRNGSFWENFCAGTEIAVPILGVAPVDIQLAVVGIPVHVRNVAVGVPGARILSVSFHFTESLSQNFLGSTSSWRGDVLSPGLMRASLKSDRQAVSLKTVANRYQYSGRLY